MELHVSCNYFVSTELQKLGFSLRHCVLDYRQLELAQSSQGMPKLEREDAFVDPAS